MKNKLKHFIAVLAVFAILCSSCKQEEDVISIKFNQDFKYTKYDGRTVSIRGYMSLLSPVDGRFVYIMNIPYQSCPFCLPNTMTVTNTVAVYAPDGQRLEFTENPVEVTGTLKVGDITDEFGYEYAYAIVNAKYTELDTSKLSQNLKIYGALSQDGLISETLRLTWQVDNNAFFEVFGGTAEDIKPIESMEFDSLIRKIEAISKSDYAELISILRGFQEYNDIVNTNIEAGEYGNNVTDKMEGWIIHLFDELNSWLNKFEI